jgi:hypothetical protein
MIKKGAILFGLTAFLFSSCIEHEVIPPPVPTVDLQANFYGEINGAQVELTENVLGYANYSTKAKIILPPPSFSSAVYYSEMSSNQVNTGIKIGLGSVSWDASLSAEPSLNAFNSFFSINNLPPFSNNGSNGFEVTYTDGFGSEWKSDDTRTPPFNDVEFTGITQESDSTGDYSQFICNFECYAYNFDYSDSVLIQNATYTGWFKR